MVELTNQAGKEYAGMDFVDPETKEYIHIALEVEKVVPFLPCSRAKKELISNLKNICLELGNDEQVSFARVFKAMIIPPVPRLDKELDKTMTEKIGGFRFDVAVLIECDNALDVMKLPIYEKVMSEIEGVKRANVMVARNVRKWGVVKDSVKGVFLFNYFHALDKSALLPCWEHVGRWFKTNTKLDNSLLLEQVSGSSDVHLINHCRWNKLFDLLPSLIFRPTAKSFVAKNFEDNKIGVYPILYRRA